MCQKWENFYFFNCPHCGEEIIVHKSEVNCKIFRHGVYKSTKEQINPHMSKKECDRLYNSGKYMVVVNLLDLFFSRWVSLCIDM